MNKTIKASLIALAFTFSIHSIIVLMLLILNAFNYDDFIEIFAVTNILLFFPTFFSFCFFDKNLNFKKLLFKVFSINFASVFLALYIAFKYVYNDDGYELFSVTNFSIAIISSFISVFFNFFQKINLTRVSKLSLFSGKIDFSYGKLFLISFSGSLIYILIMAIDNIDIAEAIQITYKFTPLGFIFSLLSIHSLNYIYSQFEDNKRKFYVVSYYVLSVSFLVFWIVLSFNNFRIVKSGLGSAIDRAFLIPSILLYSPFFLYVITITHFYFLKIVNKREIQLLKKDSLENQLNFQQLKNQLSPHFLFNNINVLTSFIEENPKKAVAYADNLANIYQYFLEQEKQDVVKVEDEIKFAQKYLQLLKDRFEEGLQYQININESRNNKYIVATILQQVLENVVKHNVIDENKVITINISSIENYLIISNNKNLKQSVKQKSQKGINNIQQRIAFFTDKKIIIENTKDNYTIKLPILEIV